MEFMLLWMDNLDDALCALRHLAPKIMGFLLATALFAATGFALIVSTQLTLVILAVTSSVVLIEQSRRRRLGEQRLSDQPLDSVPAGLTDVAMLTPALLPRCGCPSDRPAADVCPARLIPPLCRPRTYAVATAVNYPLPQVAACAPVA